MRGMRHCPRCASVTRHTAIREISPIGRGIMVLSVLTTGILYLHNWLRMPSANGDPTMLMFYWILPVVFGGIVFGIGMTRKRFLVRCDRCSSSSYRFSAPRWASPEERAAGSAES
jgi:hypothetical protein